MQFDLSLVFPISHHKFTIRILAYSHTCGKLQSYSSMQQPDPITLELQSIILSRKSWVQINNVLWRPHQGEIGDFPINTLKLGIVTQSLLYLGARAPLRPLLKTPESPGLNVQFLASRNFWFSLPRPQVHTSAPITPLGSLLSSLGANS